MKRSLVLLLILVSTISAHVGKKERDWKAGKLLDVTQSVRSNGVPSGRYTLTIQGDGYTYFVSYARGWKWSKEASLTVNTTVKYAIEKDSFYLLDEKNREFKMKIEKRILREK